MTSLILYVLLWLWDNRTFDSITKANQRKLDAEQAFRKKEFTKSAELYRQITYGSIFSDPAARLNLAHSLYKAGDYKQALKHYRLLSDIENNSIASVANAQIALILVNKKDTASALTNLRTALRLEPGNALARTNYIILKKSFSGVDEQSDMTTRKRQSNQQQTNQVQPAPPPAPPQEIREVSEDLKKEELLKSLKAMNMSEEQARAILDAMKSNESQYIYQLRRKQYNTKPGQKSEIEW
ncbi:tetratricopeptide (TPR) repeat protein [Dyadobacter sp. BE34]|uniref:Tetratricopeptide (TPR) repeat protein n=1 Tax=Dyadobacter fermentans TaxID=94254 RepID=A0ABU1R640_9BACT|nr:MULTISPECIES: tetratricopeptide repeat protein [Dyadobacter]MDR6808878.1 tetratricopeptide (TPR) repeat protein [Dyadobacter fermentans]MDR7046621.1 tetratricopeptide (TPR) repeat protein [Dyadobacter sp. BE242]MDR7200935.1 tetratricopeptide (TPR) repeat protein [Dyadobacter sp. BE34]MDR7218895.1 tetratricopeptide (TPR) repeat protein [Dyadobacter sp. BE31]MDR7264895.1 tetratricopeptide (TPR) repeat protein [Dyadobacter sp. BE32]